MKTCIQELWDKVVVAFLTGVFFTPIALALVAWEHFKDTVLLDGECMRSGADFHHQLVTRHVLDYALITGVCVVGGIVLCCSIR